LSFRVADINRHRENLATAPSLMSTGMAWRATGLNEAFWCTDRSLVAVC